MGSSGAYEINEFSYTSLRLKEHIALNEEDRLGKGLAFEIYDGGDTPILHHRDSIVVRGEDGIINNTISSNIFTWGGLADGAKVGVVVPTSYEIDRS